MPSAWASETAIGFSMKTCLPASRQSRAISPWSAGGVKQLQQLRPSPAQAAISIDLKIPSGGNINTVIGPLEDFVNVHGNDELRRNLEASDTARLADGYYRSCIPHDDRRHWSCYFIDARKKRTTLVRDPSELPNKREP